MISQAPVSKIPTSNKVCVGERNTEIDTHTQRHRIIGKDGQTDMGGRERENERENEIKKIELPREGLL